MITTVPGWTTAHELDVLFRWAPKYDNSVIVEVGSFYGRTVCCFAVASPAATVYCFDRWLNDIEGNAEDSNISHADRVIHNFPLPGMVNSLENFLNNTLMFENIRHSRVQSAKEIRWDSALLIDMLFIDAEHTNPSDWEYISYFLPFIKPGGYVTGHDYIRDPDNNCFPDIVDNVKRLEIMFGNKVEIDAKSTLWRIKCD